MSLLTSLPSAAAVAWSPAGFGQQGGYLATGTIAGALTESFDTSGDLSLYVVDWAESSSSKSLRKVGNLRTQDRFQRLAWAKTQAYEKGLLAGSFVDGSIAVWDPARIEENSQALSLSSEEEGGSASADESTSESPALQIRLSSHDGTVRGLQFNPFQTSLLASGGSDSKIYLWNLQALSPSASNDSLSLSPYPPAQRDLHTAEISDLAWNAKVQHILASTAYDGQTVVWDLRQKRAVITFCDPQNALRLSSVSWNPEIATQIVVASEDDRRPLLQLWDLRNATCPIRTFGEDGGAGDAERERESGGILSCAWCPVDSSLLLTSTKSGDVGCYDPNTGERLLRFSPAESLQSPQWCFDVQWSPRNMGVFSAASMDGNVRVYALRSEEEDKSSSILSTRPPKWLERPCGAVWGFGGRLVAFERPVPPPGGPAQGGMKYDVKISTVVTDSDFVTHTDKLQSVLSGEMSASDFCQEKISLSLSPSEDAGERERERDSDSLRTWELLKLLLGEKAREHLHTYLGLERAEVEREIERQVEEPTLAEENVECGEAYTDAVKNSLLVGDFENAVKGCLAHHRYADALLLASLKGGDLWKSTVASYCQHTEKKGEPFIHTIQSMIERDYADLVASSDLQAWKSTLATLLTFASAPDLSQHVEALGERLREAEMWQPAVEAYLIAGAASKVAGLWRQHWPSLSPLELVDRLQILEKATRRRPKLDPTTLRAFISYARRLSSQGRLEAAMRILADVKEAEWTGEEEGKEVPSDLRQEMAILLDVVYHSLSLSPSDVQTYGGEPDFPFEDRRGEIVKGAKVEKEGEGEGEEEGQGDGGAALAEAFGEHANISQQPAAVPQQPEPAAPAAHQPQLQTVQGGYATQAYQAQAQTQQQPSYAGQPQASAYSQARSTFTPGQLPQTQGRPQVQPMRPGMRPQQQRMQPMKVMQPGRPSQPPMNPMQPRQPTATGNDSAGSVGDKAVSPREKSGLRDYTPASLSTLSLSSLPADYLPVFQVLLAQFAATFPANLSLSAVESRKSDHIGRGLYALWNEWSNDRIAVEVATELWHIGSALQGGDYAVGEQALTKLSQGHWDAVQTWHSALKVLMQAQRARFSR